MLNPEKTKLNSNSKVSFIEPKFVSIYYGWDLGYTYQVIFEYERFMALRAEDSNLSPSDDIDKLWHYHILDTKSYLEYCANRFGKIIHHNPADSLDKDARKLRLGNTLKKYLEKYNNFKFGQVWEIISNVSNTTNPNINSVKPIEFELPDYEKNILPNLNYIKIFIFYTYDDGYFRPKECEGGPYSFKNWKPNPNEFDRKTLTIRIDKSTSINMLKKFITNKTSHPEFGIEFYPHPTYQKILNQKQLGDKKTQSKSKSKSNSNYLNPNGTETFASNYLAILPPEKKLPDDESILEKSSGEFIFYICELVEITSNGFC